MQERNPIENKQINSGKKKEEVRKIWKKKEEMQKKK